MGDLINGRTPEIIKSGLINLLNSCGDMRGESTRCLQELCLYYGDDCCEESILSGALALIERLESERDAVPKKATKWIGVKEKLPVDNESYLCVVEDYCTGAYEQKVLLWLGGYWWCEGGNEPGGYVRYWTPLPEPPKGEDE